MGKGIEALGYVGIEASDLDAWRHFAGNTLGLQAVERTDGAVDFRMDNYAARLRIHPGDRNDLAYIGWEVADANSLEEVAARLAPFGNVQLGNADECAERAVAGLVRFSDPEGNQHEAFYGPLQRTDQPFVSPSAVRFKTGTQGMGHIVLRCHDKSAMVKFFCEILGFRVSDYIRTEVVPGRPMEITFLRCNGRHHSLALAPVRVPKRIVHLMFETKSFDDVGRALDKCLKEKVHLSFTLGRHSNDEMVSFYPQSPSGFDVEYGWGGLEVDDESWHVVVHETNSAWGHKFSLPPRPADDTAKGTEA
jgi:2,3-dihydroxybiphenyl 1,2-dioxygenase